MVGIAGFPRPPKYSIVVLIGGMPDVINNSMPSFEGDEETSLRPPPFPRAHGHGLVVEGVDMC